MAKDLILDRYGRFYEIPEYLGNNNNDLLGVCLSYRKSEINNLNEKISSNLEWHSYYIGVNPVYGLIKHYKRLLYIINDFKPDIIFSASDYFHVILGAMLAKKFNLIHLVDLYDNFESYKVSNIPGLTGLFINAVKRSNGISVVSASLKQYVQEKYKPGCHVEVIENAVDKKIFFKQVKLKARRSLNLPQQGILIGTAGALNHGRDIKILYDAFMELKKCNNIHLVLAGPTDGTIPINNSTHIHYLGELPHAKIPEVFNALDVGVICNRADEFGKYCSPQKAYEMFACGIPVVAADTGTMSDLLVDQPDCLYKPGNLDSLISAIRLQIDRPKTQEINIPSWLDQGRKFEFFMRSVIEKDNNK